MLKAANNSPCLLDFIPWGILRDFKKFNVLWLWNMKMVGAHKTQWPSLLTLNQNIWTKIKLSGVRCSGWPADDSLRMLLSALSPWRRGMLDQVSSLLFGHHFFYRVFSCLVINKYRLLNNPECQQGAILKVYVDNFALLGSCSYVISHRTWKTWILFLTVLQGCCGSYFIFTHWSWLVTALYSSLWLAVHVLVCPCCQCWLVIAAPSSHGGWHWPVRGDSPEY